MPFVLDNSVLCGWLLQDQATAYADGVAQRLRNDHAIVPALLHLEYTNVLRTVCKRGALTAERAQEMVSAVQALPLETDRSPPDPAALLATALRFDLTAYDAVYLDLALRHQVRVATVDVALGNAARAAGIGVLEL